jgi:NAD(P)H-hydrate epimerase
MPLERIDALPSLPKRPEDSHKGMYGSVLVVAGGRGMAGAAGLCGAAALRSGAGLVRVACPSEVQPTVASYEPSYMTYPLVGDDDGFLRFESNRARIESLLAHADVLAMGPGLGRSDELTQLVRWVIEEVKVPTVLDADALNALAGDTRILARAKRPLVLTPHPGECARLLGATTADVQSNREASAVKLASGGNIIVLKGAHTVVTDGARLYVNATGNPGMAKGGAGDVLTGVIAALIGQKVPAFEAAQLGVYVHGLAGDIARDHDGEIGMIAGDIVDALADAFYHLSA